MTSSNRKKVHRLWCEEGLQRRATSRRKRAGIATVPRVAADAANVVWAIDFQYDSTTDGQAIKIASMTKPVDRCCTWSNIPSPVNDSSPNCDTC